MRLTEHWTKESIHPKYKQAHVQFWKIVSCRWITLFHTCFWSFLIGNTLKILCEKIVTWRCLVMILWSLQTFLKGLDIEWSVYDRYPKDVSTSINLNLIDHLSAYVIIPTRHACPTVWLEHNHCILYTYKFDKNHKVSFRNIQHTSVWIIQ